MSQKIKIILANKFFDPRGTSSIKGFKCLNTDERNAFWGLLELILKNNSIEGKNKPSDIKDKYDPVSNTITETLLTHPAAFFFGSGKYWHYHLNTSNCTYNVSLYNRPTEPIMMKNLYGKTCDFLVHYLKEEKDDVVTLRIMGISPHKKWNDLHQFIENPL